MGPCSPKSTARSQAPSKLSSRFQARIDAQARSQPTAKPAQYFFVLLHRPFNTSQLSTLFLCLFKGTAQIIGTSGLTPGKFNQELEACFVLVTKRMRSATISTASLPQQGQDRGLRPFPSTIAFRGPTRRLQNASVARFQPRFPSIPQNR